MFITVNHYSDLRSLSYVTPQTTGSHRGSYGVPSHELILSSPTDLCTFEYILTLPEVLKLPGIILGNSARVEYEAGSLYMDLNPSPFATHTTALMTAAPLIKGVKGRFPISCS